MIYKLGIQFLKVAIGAVFTFGVIGIVAAAFAVLPPLWVIYGLIAILLMIISYAIGDVLIGQYEESTDFDNS